MIEDVATCIQNKNLYRLSCYHFVPILNVMWFFNILFFSLWRIWSIRRSVYHYQQFDSSISMIWFLIRWCRTMLNTPAHLIQLIESIDLAQDRIKNTRTCYLTHAVHSRVVIAENYASRQIFEGRRGCIDTERISICASWRHTAKLMQAINNSVVLGQFCRMRFWKCSYTLAGMPYVDFQVLKNL